MRKPLAIDLFCGLGGWTEALLAEGYDVIGFDNERHDYGTGGYPGQLVLQDVCTLHGAQFVDADLIVASSPCQEFSYRAMPWKRAKALGPPVLGINLFWQAFRIQHEIFEACGRHVPLVAENVRGAQPWVGRAVFNYGSFYLWGDVPALMPRPKVRERSFQSAAVSQLESQKQPVWFNDDKRRAIKCGGDWFGSGEDCSLMRRMSSKSNSRKAASAQIAKIPEPLARHIAQVFKPA